MLETKEKIRISTYGESRNERARAMFRICVAYIAYSLGTLSNLIVK